MTSAEIEEFETTVVKAIDAAMASMKVVATEAMRGMDGMCRLSHLSSTLHHDKFNHSISNRLMILNIILRLCLIHFADIPT